MGVPRGLSPHRVSRQEPGPELPAEFQGHGGKHSSSSPLPSILLPPPSFPPLLTSLCPLRCWRSCRPPRDPPCSSPSLSSLLPSGRSWQPSSSSSPSCSPQTHKHREQWLYVDLLTWGEVGPGAPLRRHTTLLQMVPSASISHCTSSPGCKGGHTVAPVPAGVPVSPPAPISPHLQENGRFAKQPHSRGGPRQQDIPRDQCHKPGGIGGVSHGPRGSGGPQSPVPTGTPRL